MPSNGSGRAALAETFLPEGIARAVGVILLVLAGTLLIAIAAKIKVPFWPVPITLQTLAVMAIAAAYGSRLAVATVVAYLAEGLVGLPVFTNTPPLAAGPAYFLGPTGGFLIGFIVIAFVVGLAADRGWSRSIPKLAAAILVADVIMMAMGFAWFAGFAHLSNGQVGPGMAFAWQWGVQPFILGELLKIALVALAVPAVWGLIGRKA
ncbi:MAG: biotin transporter BioY [Bauldia sp.]|nr:biotin transporter BioY [Bauldia sp.]MCB1497196.1 biotin transporter BioY [Bauldia sp.]